MHKRDLKQAMWAAYAAGFDKKPPLSWLKNHEAPEYIRRGSLETYIFSNPTHVYIAFQGTEVFELGDVWTDLNYHRVKLSGIPGKWHQGFAIGAGKFFVEIVFWLRKNLKGRKLTVTGFSLGAGLAQCLSAYLSLVHVEHTTFAFGGPRVANRRAGQWLANRTEHYRVHTYDDWVPHLPPFFLGFKHFGKLGVFNQQGKLLTGPKAWLKAGLHSFGSREGHGHHRLKYLLLVLGL
jgi:hypothetical protein